MPQQFYPAYHVTIWSEHHANGQEPLIDWFHTSKEVALGAEQHCAEVPFLRCETRMVNPVVLDDDDVFAGD
jgi:hypothetical protein